MRVGWIGLVACLAGAAVGCSLLPTPAERRAHAEALAQDRGWAMSVVPAGAFELAVWRPAGQPPGDRLTVYIEGDGFAWVTASQPSDDPTPREPVALRMALAQPGGAVAYLARPCQYVGAASRGCTPAYWTDGRYAAEVIDAMGTALDGLRRDARARELTLVGYSGGAAVAALLAARRGDVDRLVTVAGNLDLAAWTAWHAVRPLAGSLDPAAHVGALGRVGQRHFAGAQDRVVPPALIQGFAERFAPGARPPVTIVPGVGHEAGWVQAWPSLWGSLGWAP